MEKVPGRKITPLLDSLSVLTPLKNILRTLLASTLTMATLCSLASDIELPSLGDTTSGIVSQQQEYELGRSWLRVYRSRVPLHDDPELLHYLEQLTYRLASHSSLHNPDLELLLINNPNMNAFAVPGGVIGIHTGLFRFAKSEAQLSSVIAHELAHLSQRHFARQVENRRENSATTMAGLLASLVLAATVGSDAGLAALSVTQAAAIEDALRYSRSNEQEADRIGIETLYAAKMDPAATSQMFEQMMRATRYTGHKPPEFLLTHPLTERRIADTANRIAQFPARQYTDNPLYYIMKARALLAVDNNPQLSIQRFQNELSGHTQSKQGSLYGLAIAQIAAGEHSKARKNIVKLLSSAPNNIHYQVAEITNEKEADNLQIAIDKANKLIPQRPNYYPLKLLQAESYLEANRYDASEAVLVDLARLRPSDPQIWYLLAEVRGLAGNITGLHQARAEYFILSGVFDQARKQLTYAAKLSVQDPKQSAIISQRLRELKVIEDKTNRL